MEGNSERGAGTYRTAEETTLTPKVYQRAAARCDLVDYLVYLAEHAGVPTVERLLAQAENVFAPLAAQPHIGAALPVSWPELAGLRGWHVEDFENS